MHYQILKAAIFILGVAGCVTNHGVKPTEQIRSVASQWQANNRETLLKLSATVASDSKAHFCSNEMLKRYLVSAPARGDVNRQESYELSDLSQGDLLKLVEKRLALERENLDSWSLALIPSSNSRLWSISDAVLFPKGFIFMPGNEDHLSQTWTGEFLTAVENMLDNHCSGSYTTFALHPAPVDSLLVHESAIGTQSTLENHLALAKVCSEHVSILAIPNCVNTSEKLAEVARANFLAFPELFYNFLTDPVYDLGVQLSAKRIINRYRMTLTDLTANLYDDLKVGFKEAGATDFVADELTWDTLGLIATAGSNLKKRLDGLELNHEKWLTVTALTTIVALLPSLDLLFQDSGHLYSYPQLVATTCDNGKPYHFWLAGYIARWASRQSGDAQVGMAVAFIAAKAYQLRGDLVGGTRKKGGIFLQEAYSPANQIARADVAFDAVGAYFGAASVGDHILPIDQNRILANEILSAKADPPMSQAEVENSFSGLGMQAYNRWLSQTGANETFKEASERPLTGHISARPAAEIAKFRTNIQAQYKCAKE